MKALNVTLITYDNFTLLSIFIVCLVFLSQDFFASLGCDDTKKQSAVVTQERILFVMLFVWIFLQSRQMCPTCAFSANRKKEKMNIQYQELNEMPPSS